MIGPIRPPMRGTLDPQALIAGVSLGRYRTRGAQPEATGARSFALGFVFGCVVMFGVIVWLTIGVKP